MRCPICNKEFLQSDPNVVFPFCSKRCQQIDAKRWFNEEYTVYSLNIDKLEREIAEGSTPSDGDSHSENDGE
ncbi:MAG: DNA gyrase inhibitor YacG [Thermoguttaceae bacterium]|nr:DNA gyrase inhibitor YacG [Thermoguttaceae bacterium]